jgi:hypothetical protein
MEKLGTAQGESEKKESQEYGSVGLSWRQMSRNPLSKNKAEGKMNVGIAKNKQLGGQKII